MVAIIWYHGTYVFYLRFLKSLLHFGILQLGIIEESHLTSSFVTVNIKKCKAPLKFKKFLPILYPDLTC